MPDNPAPWSADIKSISLLAQYLLLGSTEGCADDFEGQISSEMQDFLRRTESAHPEQRLAADPLVKMALFDKERLAQ